MAILTELLGEEPSGPEDEDRGKSKGVQVQTGWLANETGRNFRGIQKLDQGKAMSRITEKGDVLQSTRVAVGRDREKESTLGNLVLSPGERKEGQSTRD